MMSPLPPLAVIVLSFQASMAAALMLFVATMTAASFAAVLSELMEE